MSLLHNLRTHWSMVGNRHDRYAMPAALDRSARKARNKKNRIARKAAPTAGMPRRAQAKG